MKIILSFVPFFLLTTCSIVESQVFGQASSVEEATSLLKNMQNKLQERSFSAQNGRSTKDSLLVKPSRLRGWSENSIHSTSVMKLKTPQHKMAAIRKKFVDLLVDESRQVSSENESVLTVALLAFGVLLFDFVGDAIFGTSTEIRGEFGMNNMNNFIETARETVLPSYGVFGDNFNDMAEIGLNMLTIYMYRDESPDCGERLLCESNQQAVSRGLFDSFLTYISGFAISFILDEAPVSKNLEAMRAGRTGKNCGELFPRCAISL